MLLRNVKQGLLQASSMLATDLMTHIHAHPISITIMVCDCFGQLQNGKPQSSRKQQIMGNIWTNHLSPMFLQVFLFLAHCFSLFLDLKVFLGSKSGKKTFCQTPALKKTNPNSSQKTTTCGQDKNMNLPECQMMADCYAILWALASLGSELIWEKFDQLLDTRAPSKNFIIGNMPQNQS